MGYLIKLEDNIFVSPVSQSFYHKCRLDGDMHRLEYLTENEQYVRYECPKCQFAKVWEKEVD